MAVRIRLQRHGRRKRPFYHLVVADSRAPRDGKFIEKLGYYDPLTQPATIEINFERALYWLSVGAQPTETASAILRFKGVLYKRHLDIGVQKGALTPEQAEAKFQEWLQKKELKLVELKKKYDYQKNLKREEQLKLERKKREEREKKKAALTSQESSQQDNPSDHT
ncbi:MAG: 30S ribosomal protein S16 [Bacteroidales bacterium]|nr:30S ribosomal protein S16 [Bacteroidales bacterium]